ncbi:MAG TPA: efflux RND transporter permease subunit [Candidatus Krumholzibacteriaceae bacterium]
MTLVAWIDRYRKAIFFLAAMVIVFGVAVAIRMPVSLFPDITYPRIVLLVDNGEQPAERMMVEVTKPLEEAVNSIPGVTLVRSKTSKGSAEISIGLDWKTDVQQALQLIQGRIANIRNLLPSEAQIQAEQMTVSIFPIQGYSLTSDTLSLAELRDIAVYQIRPALLRIHGVTRVEVTGGDTREFQAIVSPEKLASYRLTMRQVAEAVERTNSIGASGLVDSNHELYLSIVSGALASVGDIENVVVAVHNGVPVRVGDLAHVTAGIADSYIRTTAHGRDAVLVNIIKQPTGSTVQIGQEVTRTLASIRLPRSIHFETFYDQSDFINRSIRNTRDSILIGIILAMVVLFLFLGSWRITVVMALVVPATIAATIISLYLAGKSINIMTLGGIAAAIGLIIDDAIVVVENIFTQFTRVGFAARGERRFFAAASGSIKELMPAIAGSTACTIVIQIPLVFLKDVTGAFFTPLAMTMIFALLFSFIFSITLAPLIASFVLRERDIEHEAQKERGTPPFWPRYEATIRAFLKRRYLFIPAALAILAVTVALYGRIGSEFMPEMDEGAFVLDYNAPPGTSLDETNRMLMHVERILASVPEVESYSRRTGTQLGFFITEPNSGDFCIKLKQHRSRGINEVMADVRDKVESSEPALRIEFGQLMMDVIGDLVNGPSPIEIKLFGNDAAVLHKTAQETARLIETVPGVVDVFDGIVISGPSIIVKIDPLRAAKAGFDATAVQEELDALMAGRAGSMIQKGEKMIAVRVRYPDAYRKDLDRIEELKLVNPAGASIPLSGFATFEKTGGEAELNREGLRQLVSVTARISGRDLGHTIADVKKKLSESLNLPRGITLSYGGVYQTQQESFQSLLIVALTAVLLVFVILLFEFREFTVPVSILIIDVLSMSGVFAALWLTRVSFNISSFVGVIMIIGIVAENAIFVMHSVKMSQTRGNNLDDALVEACRVRTRPILMTTLGAVLAFLPLALGIGTGAQMQQPLAIAVIGGFSVSSLLLFFGLPVVYRLLKANRL